MNRTAEASRGLLADLVGDLDLFRANLWGQHSRKFRPGHSLKVPRITDIWSMLECGLLVDPYFTVIKDGIPVRASQTRIVLQRPTPNYADSAAVRKLIGDGCVLKLSQPEDWNLDIRHTLEDVQTELRTRAKAQIWLCPPGAQFMDESAPPEHAFVLQLDGRGTWLSCKEEFRLLPGEMLYVPSFQRRRASAQDSSSLFLLITAQPPTALDIAELALANFLKSPAAQEVEGTHHLMTPQEKAAWLRAELGAYLDSLDLGSLVEGAVSVRQREG